MGTWKKTANSKGAAGGEYEQPPAGNHCAVLVAMIDLGEQRQEPYEAGGKITWPHRIYWCWELCDEKKSGSTANHTIGMDLTFSLHEKAKMRGFVEARRGSKIPDSMELDISEELGKPCLLNVVMKGDYPKIEGLGALPKGMPTPIPTYPLTILTLDDLQAGATIPEWVPWLYGESLSDVWKRAKELTGKAPAPAVRVPKEAPTPAPAAALTPPRGTPAADRWDYSDGKTVHLNKTTEEVTAALAGKDLSFIRVRIHGQPKETARTALEWALFDAVGTDGAF